MDGKKVYKQERIKDLGQCLKDLGQLKARVLLFFQLHFPNSVYCSPAPDAQNLLDLHKSIIITIVLLLEQTHKISKTDTQDISLYGGWCFCTKTALAYWNPFTPFLYPVLFRAQQLNAPHLTTPACSRGMLPTRKRGGRIKHLAAARVKGDRPDPGSDKTATALVLCF